MKIKSLEELEKNDIIVVQIGPNQVELHTVLEVYVEDSLIISQQSQPLDISIEDPSEIAVLS